MEQPFDVVVVGAHPDDVEIACGGTLALLVDQGYRVAIVDLTDGEPTPHSPGPEVRIAEAHEAARVLGVQKRIILELPNRRLMDGFEARVALAKQFRILRPRIVIGFGQRTPLASPDHEQAMHITHAAVFYSRLTKWDEHFDHLPVHTIQSQLYFRLGFDTPPPGFVENSFTVDISTTLERKLDSIRCYRTQFPENKQSIFERVQANAISTGAAAGFRAGEVFSNAKALGVKDLYHVVANGGLR
ncbi:MAG: PIG-L family deacetylase [Pirellulales bacterium]